MIYNFHLTIYNLHLVIYILSPCDLQFLAELQKESIYWKNVDHKVKPPKATKNDFSTFGGPLGGFHLMIYIPLCFWSFVHIVTYNYWAKTGLVDHEIGFLEGSTLWSTLFSAFLAFSGEGFGKKKPNRDRRETKERKETLPNIILSFSSCRFLSVSFFYLSPLAFLFLLPCIHFWKAKKWCWMNTTSWQEREDIKGGEQKQKRSRKKQNEKTKDKQTETYKKYLDHAATPSKMM